MAKKFSVKKRLFEDFSNVEPSTADVHCAIETLSPAKKAKSGVNFFEGYVSDGTRRLRLVGFNMKTLEQLSEYHAKNAAVKLDNCLIKKSISDDLEILVNKTTSISQSPFKFDVKPKDSTATIETQLCDVDNLDDGTKINVKATVLSVAPVRPVSTGKIQEVIICDSTASINLSVWEENTDQLEVGKSYLFTDVFVRSYRDEKSISLSRRSTYKEIDNPEMSTVEVDEEVYELKEAQIIGVQNFVVHLSCVHCDGKLQIQLESRTCAKCSKCGIVQLKQNREYELAATLLVQSKDSNTKFLKVCTQSLLKILPQFDFSDPCVFVEEKLLNAPKMTISYTGKMGYVKDIQF